MKPKTYLTVDLNKIKNNILSIQEFSNKEIMPVIKSNAYGHGIVEVARYLEKNLNPYFAVAKVSEALLIRKNNIKSKVLVLGHTDIEDFKICELENIDVTIHDKKGLIEIKKFPNLKFHLKIDTGMNRIGFMEKDFPFLYDNIYNFKNLIGVFSHFSNSDNLNDSTYLLKQIDIFSKFIENINLNETNIKYIHLNNSAAAI